MRSYNPRVLLLLCSNCAGMPAKLIPEIKNRYAENIKVESVNCPSEIDAFMFIKMLRESVDGIVVACPKAACCCPDNRKVIRRKQLVRDILPIFGLHREQFQIASVSPLGGQELMEIIEQMLAFVKTLEPEVGFEHVQHDEIAAMVNWIN